MPQHEIDELYPQPEGNDDSVMAAIIRAMAVSNLAVILVLSPPVFWVALNRELGPILAFVTSLITVLGPLGIRLLNYRYYYAIIMPGRVRNVSVSSKPRGQYLLLGCNREFQALPDASCPLLFSPYISG